MSGAHRMESTSASGSLSLPSKLDSDSRYTGRSAEKFWKAAQSLLSKSFWEGWGWPGSSPNTEPLWLARPSRSIIWQGATLTLVIGTDGGLAEWVLLYISRGIGRVSVSTAVRFVELGF